MKINKKDTFAIWGVKGKTKEIVIHPSKCKDIKWTDYKKSDNGDE